MNPWHILVIFVIYFPVSYADCNVSECTLLKELECALYTTDFNERTLNQAFFPPRKATSRYIKVDYVFNTTIVDNCTVTYIWSIGGFLLIQPPSIFQLTSLMFSYPTNDIDKITLLFPSPCIEVINITDDRKCSCAGMENGTLDILTQQLLQYSKFSNPDRIVRDVTSVAQALCVEDIESGYFNHRNVTVYIAAKIVLPVMASVACVVGLSSYYPLLIEKVTNPTYRPTFVGVLMAGIYLSLYILAVDIAAIVFYVANKTEYQFSSSIAKSLSLQLVYYSFASECALATLALIVATILHTRFGNERKFMWKRTRLFSIILVIIAFVFTIFVVLAIVVLYPSNASIILCTVTCFLILIITTVTILSQWTTPTNFFLIWFITVPLILGSAHIDYILVAWLTEPAKTTSVSILAIALVFYLFALSRFLYKYITKIASKLKQTYWEKNIADKKRDSKFYNFLLHHSEGLKLVFTVILGFAGVVFASLQIAAFYLLPFPSIRLVDYLDNIFQISLVIFGGLITYKVISNKESDITKFLKQFNSMHESSSKMANAIDLSESDELKTELTLVVNNDVETGGINLPPVLKFVEKVLVVAIPQQQGDKETKIPISGFKMRDKWSRRNNHWRLSLESSEVNFYLFDASVESHKFTVGLKNSKFMLISSTGHTISGLTADLELYVVTERPNESFIKIIKKSVFQDSCDMIKLEENCKFSLQIPVQCYFITTPFLGTDDGVTCYLKNSVSIFARSLLTSQTERYLIPCDIKSHIPVSTGNNCEFSLHDHKFKFTGDNDITVIRHSTSVFLKFSLDIQNESPISFRFETDDQTKTIILQWNQNSVKIPLDYFQHDIFMLELNVDRATGNANPGIQTGNANPGIQLGTRQPMNLSPDKNVYAINFRTHTGDVFMYFPDEDIDHVQITDDFQYFKVTNVQTASFTVTNPVPIDFKLKHHNGLVDVTWKDSGKISTIIYVIPEINKFIIFEVNSYTIDPPLLFFPLNNKNKWKLHNEIETAAQTCRKLAQRLVEHSKDVPQRPNRTRYLPSSRT